MKKIFLSGILFVVVITNLKAQNDLSLLGDSTIISLPPFAFPTTKFGNDSTNHSFLPKAKVYVKENIHGIATVDYSYRDGNYAGQTVPKHLFRYRISPNVQIGAMPLNLNIGYSSDYQGQLGKLYSLGFKLDYKKLQENLLKAAQNRLQSEWIYNDSLLKILQAALDTLPKLDSLVSLQTRINTDFDSLTGLAPELPDFNQYALDSLDNLKHQMDSHVAHIQSMVKYRDQLLKLRESYRQKRSEIVSRSKNLKNPDLKGLDPRDKFLQSIKVLELGSFSLNYGNYFAKGGQYFGAHTAFLVKGFQIISFAGTTRQNNNFFRPMGSENSANSFRFIGGGFQFGSTDNSIQILAATGNRKNAGNEVVGESNYTLYPDKNSVYSLVFNKKAGRSGYLYGEWAYSQYSRNILPENRVQEITVSTSPGSQAIDNSAGILGFRGEAKLLDLNYDLSVSQSGADYYSFANPYQRTDIRLAEAKLGKKFWRSRLSWKGHVQYGIDNVSGKKSASTTTSRYTNTVSTNFAKAPSVILSHTWVKLRTSVKESNFEMGYAVSVMALTITKTWMIKEKIALSNTATWMNSTSFNFKTQIFQTNTISIQNALLFGKMTLQHAFQANHTREMWGELSNQIVATGAVNKKVSAGLSVGRIDNLIYKTQRNQIAFKIGYQVFRFLNVEGSFEYMKYKETQNSLSIGNLSAQLLW